MSMIKQYSKYLLILYWAVACKSYDYEERYFVQKVDHFSFVSDHSFKQRYLINLQHYNSKNGTIFFYTGNEGDIEMFTNNTGFMWENAEEFSAGLVFAEHRYYGKSLPYGESSMKDNEHRGYLSSEQALADFAALIFHLKRTLPGAERIPIIAFGGSYGGMLAAWIRIKYPHLVKGAVASSAPILMFEGLTPCGKFAEIVTQDFLNVHPTCPKSIQKSWRIIRKYGETDNGARYLSETFRTCQPLTSSNASRLVDWLYDTWSYLAMVDYPYASNFLNPLPANPVKVACQFLTDESVSTEKLILNIMDAASVFHNYSGSSVCNNLNEGGGSNLGDQVWAFQECTEMIGPICYDGKTDMFEPIPWNFAEFSLECKKKWNLKPDPLMLSVMYGGRNLTASSNIVFSNGKLDPWYAGGILKSLSKTLVAIQIDNAAHHLDLRASNVADPTSVKDARRIIKKCIYNWISELKYN